MMALFPDTDPGARLHYTGYLWDRPPELDGAVLVWECDHGHDSHDGALACAVSEMRHRWVNEALGVPEGWRVLAVPKRPGHPGSRWGWYVKAPAGTGADADSGCRYRTRGAALRAGAQQAIASARSGS